MDTDAKKITSVKFLGCEFAPLWIPWSRRLQTLSVTFFFLSLLAGMFIIVPLFAYLLFFSQYWQIPVLSITWIIYDWETPFTGGRRWRAFRNYKIWHYVRDYFPVKLVKTADLSPDKNYMFCVYPHGIASVGTMVNFMSNANNFDQLFPGIYPHLVTLNTNFKIPFTRDLFLACGAVNSSARSILHVLSSGPGASCVLMPGGANEAMYASPKEYTIILKKRRGFVRLALMSGASLVPVFAFGENDLYEQVRGDRLRRVQDRFRALSGVAPCMIKGRGFFQYTLGLLPHRKQVVSVVGEPIHLPQTENPTDELISEYHEKYEAALRKLFDSYKGAHDPLGDAAELVIL